MSFAAVRRAVRDALRGHVAPLVACSGGPDSLALAAAVAALRPGARALVVDHGLQEGSAEVAATAVATLTGLGLAATVRRVEVRGDGGPEAAARRARYAALEAARPHPDSPVLLGHTLDDQAETVLLGLGRGSGPRSIAGMRVWTPPLLRPLLGVRRRETVAACAELGLATWADPHNDDPRYTRVRLRHEVLPLVEDVLGGGVAEALARTAAQLREDTDALDELATAAAAAATDGDGRLRLDQLAATHPAIRRRALRAWLDTRGVTGLTAGHLAAADGLTRPGPDKRGVALPGGYELVRVHGRLDLVPVDWPVGGRRAQEERPRVRR